MNYTTENPADKKNSNLSLEDIEDYSRRARNGQVEVTIPFCPACKTLSEYFKRHDARKRQLLVPVAQIIRTMCCFLVRWRCPGCNKRLPQYPDFMLPYKRYPRQAIMEHVAQYVENDQSSYRDILKGEWLGHREHDNDERQLSHVSIWRWVETIARYEKHIASAQDMILQADPASVISRHLAALTVPAKKYATGVRKKLLRQCRRVLHGDAAYRNCFGFSFFPNLATAKGRL
ncbi:MAG: DUF6431 domain-containing protein [Thermodesulfobacteriota bacterium]|nr:DUF6431 domain-containing protein [Thermodesulfobacteriota bacterium]